MSASSSNTDLRNRIIFTLAILVVYRFGTFVPLPGIDPEQLKIMMEGNQKGLLGMFNVFAGGAVSRMAIFALGIMPYISSSIIVQLLTGVSDYFKNLISILSDVFILFNFISCCKSPKFNFPILFLVIELKPLLGNLLYKGI